MLHLMKIHNHVITDYTNLLKRLLGYITLDVQSALDNIAHGKLDIQIDGLMTVY